MGGGFAKLTAVMLQETRAVDLQKFRGGFRVVWAMDLQGPRVEGGRWICKLGRRGSRRRIWKAGGVPWPVLERSFWFWFPGLAVCGVSQFEVQSATDLVWSGRFSPLCPQGIFQISPQPISIGNMQTLAFLKER